MSARASQALRRVVAFTAYATRGAMRAAFFLRSLFAHMPGRECAEARETFHCDAPTSTLHLDNPGGRTRVIGEARGDLQVAVHKFARAESREHARARLTRMRVLRAHTESGALELAVNIPGSRHGRMDLEVRVPRGTTVCIASVGGRICLSGLRAAVTLRSSNGPVRVTDVVGDIEIQTSNARVYTQCTCGALRARSSNGKIELAEHTGSVDAATSNGVIQCELSGLNASGCQLVTSNGRISLALPLNVDGDLDVHVDNGRIQCAREFAGVAGESSGRLKGQLGRGGAPIRLRASNGTVSLRARTRLVE